MKLRKLLSILLVLAMTVCMLSACGSGESGTESGGGEPADPYEGLTLYEHPVGLSLKMAEGFTQSEVEGILACYEGERSNVRMEAEAFTTLEALGYNGSEMTEEEYGQLIREAYALEGDVQTDDYGNVYIAYNQEVQEVSVSYFAFFDKGEDAFWTTTFMCMTEQAEELEPDFHLWAGTIQVGAAPAQVATEEVLPQQEALSEEESEDLLKTLEKIRPVDFLGKSFVTAELSDEEMLRLVYAVFGAQEYGIVGYSGESFRDIYAADYFDRGDLEMADMVCSCGELLAAYDSAEDQYNWDGKFHDYTAHQATVINEYLEAYKQDGSYIVTAYKLFSDLNENIDSDTISFYATYEDAKNQANALFSASSEEEMTNGAAAVEETQKVLYTYIFEKNEEDRFVLREYHIGA